MKRYKNDKIALNLKVLRVKRGLTLAELADKCGMSATALSYIERQKLDSVNYTTLKKLANALNVEISELVEESL